VLRIAIFIVAISAINTAFMVYAQTRSKDEIIKEVIKKRKLVDVVVAKMDIPAGTVITKGMVELLAVPSKRIMPGDLTAIKSVIGKVATKYIFMREHLNHEALKIKEKRIKKGQSVLAKVNNWELKLKDFEKKYNDLKYYLAKTEYGQFLDNFEFKSGFLNDLITIKILSEVAKEKGMIADDKNDEIISLKYCNAPEEGIVSNCYSFVSFFPPPRLIDGEKSMGFRGSFRMDTSIFLIAAEERILSNWIRQDLLLASKLLNAIKVSPQEIADFYEKNKDFFEHPKEYETREIIADVGDEKFIEKCYADILGGKPFAQAAKDSHRGRYEKGGYVGWVYPDAQFLAVVPEYWEEIKQLKEGQMSKVFKRNSYNAYCIVKVEKIREMKPLDSSRVKQEIEKALWPAKIEREIRWIIDEYKKTMPVETHEDLLK